MRARFLALFLLLLASAPLAAQKEPYALEQTTPLFTENRGQIVDLQGALRPDILFSTPVGSARLYLRRNSLSYVFARLDRDTAGLAVGDRVDTSYRSGKLSLYRMDVEFVGAASTPTVTTASVAGEYSNYYLPHCRNGIVGVQSYGEVTYHNLYPNIDLVLRSTEAGVKSEFVVYPGADPSLIRIRYNGSNSMELMKQGSLHVGTPLGGIDESAPYSFLDGTPRTLVESHYSLKNGEVGFVLGTYNRNRTLTIDPLTRTWATCIGGSLADYGLGVAASRDGGGIYTGGYALSTDFPATPGVFQTSRSGGIACDLFVMRFTPTGTRRWATYIGGTGDETGGLDRMVTTGPNGDVAITGSSFSPDFPTSPGAYQRSNSGTAAGTEPNEDAVVAVFDNTGMRRWATYLGGSRDANGSRVYNADRGWAIAYDRPGNLVVTGYAFSQDFPVSASGFQTLNPGGTAGSAFITRFNPVGGVSWSTYFGGSGGSAGYDVITADSDKIYVAGRAGAGLPTTPGAYQMTGTATGCAFVAVLDSSGARRWATYFGPTYSAHGIAVDATGAVIITGETSSASMPTTPGAYRTSYNGGNYDVFVARLSANGSRLLRSTYFGSTGEERAYGLVLDRQGGVWVSGYTTGSVFPVSAGAFQMSYGGGVSDAFVIQFDSAGRLLYSTLYGGGGGSSNGQDVGTDVAFDSSGALYVGGYTESLNFPTSAGAFQTGTAGLRDGFLIKFDCLAPTPSLDSLGMLCAGDTTSRVFLVAGAGYRSYRWNTGDTTRSISVRLAGTYSLTVIDSVGCISSPRSITVRDRQRPDATILSSALMLCPGDSAVLQAGPIGSYSYRWSTGSTAQRIVIRDSGLYTVTVTDTNGCFNVARVPILFYRPARPVILPDTVWLCAGDSSLLTASDSGYTNWQWSNGLAGRQIVVRDTGRYTVTTLDTNGCYQTSLATVVRRRASPAARILPLGSTTLCTGDSVVLNAFASGFVNYRWNTGATTSAIVVRTSGIYRVTVVDKNGCRDSTAISVSVAPALKPRLTSAGNPPISGKIRLCEGDSLPLHTTISYPDVVWSDGTSGWMRTVKQSGRYSARVHDANGCTGYTDTLEVTVVARPVLDLSGAVAVCAGSRKNYTVTPQPGVQYLWSAGDGTIVAGQGSASVTVQWAAAGEGWVRLEGTSLVTGCRTVDSVGVAIGNILAPLVRTSRPTTLCPGDSIVLDAGDGYASYRWNNGAQSRTITVRNAGGYAVSVQDVEGCSGTSDTVYVRMNTPPSPSILSAGGGVICEGDSTVLDVAGLYAGYRWSTGETTPSITVRSAGNYSVEVTDTAGCTGVSDPFTVTVAVAPRAEIDGPNAACVGSQENYAVGSTIPEPVVWNVTGGSVIAGWGTRNVTVQWGAAGAGRLDATVEAGGCRRTVSYAVAIANELHPHLVGAGVTGLCVGDSLELVAPSGYARYLWSTGEQGNRITVRRGGEYWVEVGSSSGCGGVSDTAVVFEMTGPTPTIVDGGLILCSGDSTVLDAGPGYSGYRWSTGERTRKLVVRSAGHYSVAVQEMAGGCWGRSDTVEVVVNASVTPSITEVGEELESSDALAYQWSLDGREIVGATARRHRPDASGFYAVTTIDIGGCQAASAPHQFTLANPGIPHLVRLDTVEGNVGERLAMEVQVVPPLELSEGVTGYRVRIAYDPRALYLLRATSGVAGLPDPQLINLERGSAELVGVSGNAISGSVLARLELLGLLTGQPVNILTLDTAELQGSGAITRRGGVVILHGCDVGRTGDFDRAVAILGARWKDGGVEVRYRAPEGAAPQLVVYDLLGRAVVVRALRGGTGGEQLEQIDADEVPSGVYRVELRDRAERDAAGVIIER